MRENIGFCTDINFCMSSNTVKQVTTGEKNSWDINYNERVNVFSILFFTTGRMGEGKSRQLPKEAIR